MKISYRARAVAITLALLVALALPHFQCNVAMCATQPSLMEIFSSLGFTNVTQLSVETFPAGTYNITLYAKFGGDNPQNLSNVNELSFYQVNSSVFNVLYAPSEPPVFGYVIPPLTKTFSAGYTFGLSLLSWDNTRYFTETSLNPEGTPHAKVYLNLDNPSMLLLGFDENSYSCKWGDLDFNDMVVSLQAEYFLNVVSAYGTATGQGWYYNGTNAYASLTEGIVDQTNGTRRVFTQWSSDASGTNYAKSDPIYMIQNRTAVAEWTTKYYLTVKTNPAGLVTIPGEGWYDQGASEVLTAPTVDGYAFAFWDVDGASQGDGINTITVTLDRPHTVTAHYLNIYILTIEAGPGGQTDPPVGTYPTNAGSTVQVSANADAMYAFDHWELDGTNASSSNQYSVLMNANHTLKAVFRALPPLSVTIAPMSSAIALGQSVDFTSESSGGLPPYSYQWYLNGNPLSGVAASAWTFTPSASGTYSLYLKITDTNGNTAQSGTAQVTVAPPLSVSISPFDSSILPGQTVKFTSTITGGIPPYSYQWHLDGNPVSGATSSTWAFQPMKSGTYYVFLAVMDAKGHTAQSEVSRVVVISVPVGGYAISPEKPANMKPLTLSFALTIALATFFVAVKHRTTRKKS